MFACLFAATCWVNGELDVQAAKIACWIGALDGDVKVTTSQESGGRARGVWKLHWLADVDVTVTNVEWACAVNAKFEKTWLTMFGIECGRAEHRLNDGANVIISARTDIDTSSQIASDWKRNA